MHLRNTSNTKRVQLTVNESWLNIKSNCLLNCWNRLLLSHKVHTHTHSQFNGLFTFCQAYREHTHTHTLALHHPYFVSFCIKQHIESLNEFMLFIFFPSEHTNKQTNREKQQRCNKWPNKSNLREMHVVHQCICPLHGFKVFWYF